MLVDAKRAGEILDVPPSWVLAQARLDRIPRFHRLFISEPAVIIKDGRFLTDVMDREGLDREEAEMAIREHGLLNVVDVELGVLESDGSISVIGKDTQTRTRTKRRLRRRFRIGR